MSSTFKYASGDFTFKTSWNDDKNSTFDEVLRNKWTFMNEHENFFNYKLKIEHSKILQGRFKLLAQVFSSSFMLYNIVFLSRFTKL